MALLYQNSVAESTILAIWHITETLHDLESTVKLTKAEKTIYSQFASEKRKKEWLATRVLVNKINGNTIITYTPTGRPILSCNKNISISHTQNLVAILLSEKYTPGIDIEIINNKIDRLKHKFLSTYELENMPAHEKTKYLYIHWCAKESICKVTDNKKLDFINQMQIEPFNIETEGTCKISVNNECTIKLYVINYLFSDNYILTWCLK